MTNIQKYITDIKQSVECLGDSDGFKTTALESLDELEEILAPVPEAEEAVRRWLHGDK